MKQGHPKWKNYKFIEVLQNLAIGKTVLWVSKGINLVLGMTNIRAAQMVSWEGTFTFKIPEWVVLNSLGLTWDYTSLLGR